MICLPLLPKRVGTRRRKIKPPRHRPKLSAWDWQPILSGEHPDYAATLASFSIAGQEPVIVPESPVFVRDQVKLGRLLLERRLPAISAAKRRCPSVASV